MLQPSKLRAYGQNCPTIEVFPSPIIVRNQQLPWNLGKLAVGQLIIKLMPKYQAEVFIYCGNDNYQQPIYVKLGDNLTTEKPNAVIPPSKNVKAVALDTKAVDSTHDGETHDHTENDSKEKDSEQDAHKEKK